MAIELIYRERELDELRRLSISGDRRLALLYGRRQVGKTFLLSQVWDERQAFYFLAAGTTPELNRAELLRELAGWAGRSFEPADYPTWRTIFRLFVDLADARGRETPSRPLVVILDEFQYLLEGPDDAASQLVAVWDREARGSPLTLVLSGSEVGSMERLQSGGQPLFGRVNWSARLQPFDYWDAAQMVPGYPPRQAALCYGVFGGTPRYLAAVEAGESLGAAAARAMLSPRGEVHLQLQTMIEQERGIRDPSEYRAVLAAVAAGRTEINEIAQAAGLGGQPASVRRALAVLEQLEIVGRERNFEASRTAAYRHFIADNAVRFWHRFVVPNRSRLATGDPAEVWQQRVEPYLDEFMGKAFERLVEQAYQRHHTRWNLPAARTWARWEGQDRNRRSIELDIVARLDDGRVLTGEVKWSSSPRGLDLHHDLQRDLDDLARSGQRWAAEAQQGPFLYVSAAGFDDTLRALGAGRADLRLLDLSDLYA